MPTTNYLNPQSLSPPIGWQPQGAQAGRIWSERNQDYETMMRNQMLLQDMATRGQAVDTYNKIESVPVDEAKRLKELTTLNAEQPFLADLARSKSTTQLNSDAFKREVTEGPEARKAKLAELLGTIDKTNYEKIDREVKMGKQLLEGAMARGPQAGAQWVSEQLDRLEKLGYPVDRNIANPQAWSAMHRGLVEFDTEFQRKKWEVQERERGDTARNNADNSTRIQAANISAEASKANATARAAGGGKPPTQPGPRALWAVTNYKKARTEFGPDAQETKDAFEEAKSAALMAWYASRAYKEAEGTLMTNDTLRWTQEKRQSFMDEKRDDFVTSLVRGESGASGDFGAGKPAPGKPAPTPKGGRTEIAPGVYRIN